MTKFLYFAWVRERVGVAHEERQIPETVTNVTELLSWLASQGEQYENALSDAASLRVALDHIHADAQSPIKGAKEIAIFPPMTGG